MKVLPRGGWAIAVALFCFLPSVFPQAPARVAKINVRHVGPPAVSDELIRANIRVKPGDSYSKVNVDDDVRNLYTTGYFYNIRVNEELTREGLVLTYVVQGKPKLTDIKFQGNKKFNNKKLVKKVKSKIGEPLDEHRLFTDSQEIQKMYQKAGYQKTQAKYVLNTDENAGRGTVTFEIQEAAKVRIVDVEFVGAQAFSQRKLRKVIKTRRHWMFSWLTGSGTLKDEQFEDDKDKLGDFYRNEGYIDFEIKDIKFDYATPNRLRLRFVIDEGKRYKVGKVEFKGNKLFSTDEILKGLRRREGPKIKTGLSMGVGEIFTPKGLAKDVEALEDFYGARGYIDVRYPSTFKAIKNANTETGTMDLVYQIDEGEKSYVEKIEIKGNTKTKDRVIRRELAVAPGEVFNMVRVKISTNRLTQLNYFEKVQAQPEETDVPNRRNLVVGVDEKNTGNLQVGAGFSSVDNIVGFVEVSQGNFDLFNPPYFSGGGQKFRVRVQMGTRRKDFETTFIEPWLFGQKLQLGVDLYHRELNFLSSVYDLRRTGGRLSLTRALWSDYLIGSVSYTLENVGIVNVDKNASQLIQEEKGNRLVSKVGVSIAYDTRNSVLLPDRGQRTELLTEVAGGPLGGDTDFYKFELKSSWYFPGFLPGHIWELNSKAGVVESYNGSKRVPLFDRWFLGGAYSLRGFDYHDVGPKDERGEPIGGGTYWYGSAEYSVPIIERLRFAAFYDIGMVYRDAYSFGSKGTGSFNDNWGFGIRLNLPIGPLRLDYGVPIHSDRFNDSSGKFQFSVGYTRDL
jgi:outer membrane protein insertion porin family